MKIGNAFSAESLPNIDLVMDNLRRELQSHTGAGAKTSLAVCLTELNYLNKLFFNLYILWAGNKILFSHPINWL